MDDIKRGKVRPQSPKRLLLSVDGRLGTSSGATSRVQETTTRTSHFFRSRMRRKPKPAQTPQQVPANHRTVELSLNFASLIRPLRLMRKAARGHSRRKKLALVGVVLLLASAGTVSSVYISKQRAVLSDATTNKHTQQQATGPTPGTPSYATILPKGKSIGSLGGWYKVSPPGRDPVYAYVDKIGSIEVDVSEQPLPDAFKANTAGKVAELAQNFNAAEKLNADGMTVYIGTSAKGPQSLIFTKSNLLILIKSSSIVTNDQWIQYVSSLQ